MTCFDEALERHRLGQLSADEAGEALGMPGRQFRRLRVRYSAVGSEGLRDRRLGRASKRRAPEAELDRMHRLYREGFADFTTKQFHEGLMRRHNYKLDYTVRRLSLQAAGLVARRTA